MKKVFLYLYPIEEFLEWSILEVLQSTYDTILPIINSLIDRRYRQKGYKIVYALYSDKELFGLEEKDGDSIIYTDVTFSEAINVNMRIDFEAKYPDEDNLLNQLGNIDELVVAGYHGADCVRRVAEKAVQRGIDTIVDLDLTDVFFDLYAINPGYFKSVPDSYCPESFKKIMSNNLGCGIPEDGEEFFIMRYGNPIFGFDIDKNNNKK